MRRLAVAAALLAVPVPGTAQPPAHGSTTAPPVFDFALPPPADTGKPSLRALRGDGAPPRGRLQLRGNLDRNGAVELRGRAFSW